MRHNGMRSSSSGTAQKNVLMASIICCASALPSGFRQPSRVSSETRPTAAGRGEAETHSVKFVYIVFCLLTWLTFQRPFVQFVQKVVGQLILLVAHLLNAVGEHDNDDDDNDVVI